MSRCASLALALMLAACSHAPTHRGPPSSARIGRVPAESTGGVAAPTVNACAPTRQHRDEDYTAGGLYAPGVADGGPNGQVDVSGIPEPVPHDEPRSAYGNRTPYTVLGHVYHVLPRADGYIERGVASWYGSKFNGRATSSQEVYDMCAFTAAHRTLPLPSYARVTNLNNGRSVIVRINDRGPFHDGRLIDLSYAAAVRLGVNLTGTAPVEVRAIGAGEPPASDEERQAAPSSLPSPPAFAASDRPVIQVGSFRDKDNAQHLADRLDAAGIDDVDIDRTEAFDQTVWRVRIGPVDADEVSALLEKIRALGIAGARVFSQ